MATKILQLLEQAVEETYADLALHHGREHPETRPPPKTAVEAENLKLNDTAFDEAVGAHDEAIKAAIRGGSTSHPRVRAWLTTQRGQGEWDLLRRTQRGLEKGVRRPLPMQLRPTSQDAKIVMLWRKGYSLECIREQLKLQITRQAIHKRLVKLGEAPR